MSVTLDGYARISPPPGRDLVILDFGGWCLLAPPSLVSSEVFSGCFVLSDALLAAVGPCGSPPSRWSSDQLYSLPPSGVVFSLVGWMFCRKGIVLRFTVPPT